MSNKCKYNITIITTICIIKNKYTCIIWEREQYK